jgi:DNA-binding transcriptional ArsR family regulator
MPHRSSPVPTVVFRALSDATRAAVVERLSVAPASASELARPFDMALPSFMQHLGVLEEAGIVTSHKTGRSRIYQLRPEPLGAATEWLLTFRNHWQRRLDALDQVLLGDSGARSTTPRPRTTPRTKENPR